MGISNMQGTSAYLDYIGPKGKKLRRNCYYNKNGECFNNKSKSYSYKCVGRFVCGAYEERYINEIQYNQCIYYKNKKCLNSKSNLYLLNCCKKDQCIDLSTKKQNYAHIDLIKKKQERLSGESNSKIFKRILGVSIENKRYKLIGKKYLLKDLANMEEFKVIFVKEEDKNELEDKFSIYSPLAEGIILSDGNIVSLKINNRILRYEIM